MHSGPPPYTGAYIAACVAGVSLGRKYATPTLPCKIISRNGAEKYRLKIDGFSISLFP